MTTEPKTFSPPFFIIGCVRSGTTMLRNILRHHPNLASPEETHFYRWGEPFGTPGYAAHNNTVLLKKHHEMDGISDPEFKKIFADATSRGDFTARYMAQFVKAKKPQATRWFDKTPQNVYGATLLANDFPAAKFVHIVRNPVEVVASLRIGKVLKITSLVAACSYWNEAFVITRALKKRYPNRVMEFRYEDFTADPANGVRQILEFIGEPYDPAHFLGVSTSEVSHKDESVLTPEEVRQVEMLCLPGRREHGYIVRPGAARKAAAAALSGQAAE